MIGFDELVRRITWKLAHSNPTGFSFGRKHRRPRLSFPTGVVSLSLGNTQAADSVEGAFLRHSAIATSNRSENAASRSERSDFGVSSRPRYSRRVISADVPVSDPHVSARISPGRIPAMIAN